MHVIRENVTFVSLDRTVNNHGGKGRNISLDLRLEHLNNLLKEMLRCLGVNVTEISAK